VLVTDGMVEQTDPAGGEYSVKRLLDLLARVAAGPERWGHGEYAACCATLGREVTWEPAGRGRAVAVAVDGGLEVATPGGRRVLYAGEVHTVRPV